MSSCGGRRQSTASSRGRAGKDDGPLFLGIDLGTSHLKLQVIDARGAAVAEASAAVVMHIPHPGWAEQDPAGWWDGVVSACREIFAEGKVSPKQIAAVGLSGQMHGAVFVDADGDALRPCLIWADGRTGEQVAQIERRVPGPELIALTGNAPNTSFTATKVLWVQQNEPEVYARTRRVLLPKDYIRWRLAGAYATDVSDASATLMFDLARRNWSLPLLSALGIDEALLPPVFESTEITGRVTREAANATGLTEGTPVVAGGGDTECGAFGLGLAGDVSGPSVALSSIGTAGQVFAVTRKPSIDPLGRVHSLCHVVPGRWHVMGAILAGGVTLRWIRDILSPPGGERIPYDTLTAEAEAVGPGAGGVIFLPYLLGERTPHMDPQARGVFFGLRLDHTRAHLVRAVMEGVVFALRDGLEVLKTLGVKPAEMRVVGGAAQSPLWMRIQRDVFDVPVRASRFDHGAAYGAAMLAAVGAGAFESAEDAARSAAFGELSEPDPEAVAEYERAYRRFRRLYPSLHDEFKRSQ